MAEAGRQSTESTAEETENPDIAEQVDRGTYQEILNLLNIMESESEKTDIALLGLNMRKALALGIITEKANREPSAVMNVLIYCLQMPEISTQRKVTIYNVLQEILQQEGELEEQCVQRLVIIASKEMRDVLEVEGYIMADVASDTLVALSRNHFNLVMFEMQHHLKPLTLNDEFVIITLAKLANGNVFEFMPYMGITLTTIFTMLRLANEAKMRQVICRAMETFCETVQYYLRHLEDSVYPVMTQEQFANKLFPIYCYFVTMWLKNDNAEVKLAVIRCLKPMLNLLLPNDHLREQIYDYIPLMLAEYQSSMEALFITQVLRQILEAAVITHTPVPQMQLHIIFTELHTQVCSPVATQHQYSSQNQTEIVHCFIALARSYPKELMNFFLRKMEMSKEAIRVGTLSLIEAIVGADDPEMSKRTIHLAINVVKSILPDPRSKVRIAVLKIIGQLALSGYQDQIKSWGLKYVSVQLTLSTYKLKNCRDSFYLRDLKEKMVHKVTMDTVKIMTSSVSGMANEFWVRFLCYILDTDYPEALTSICISLTNLAERQIHEKDTGAGTTIPRRHVDLPAPQKLLARLLVLMSSPYKCEGRGIAILKLLRILSQSIAPSMTDVWELEIPILIQYLEEHTEFTWNQKTWEEKLIQFLKSSLRKTQGLNWSMWLSQELSNQMDHFDSPSLEKGFLYRALGVSLATGLKANKVEVLLLELLYKTDYGNDFEREGVVLSCGLCARGQVMTVLKALGEFEKRIQESEQSWQVCIWQKDQPWWQESLKSVLMDMYGCVATYCHPQMLLTQLEHIITTKIIRHYSSSCQDISLKMAFMKGIIQVAGALKTMEHLEVLQFVQKATVTSIIMEILKAEPAERLDSPVRTRALDALILLSKLKPFYSEEENNELMDICIHSVISLVPPDEDNDAIKMLYTDAMRALEELMENLMERQLDPKVLQEMVQLLEKWILSEKAWEREKALNLYLGMMQTYVQNIDICIPLKLGQFGTLVGFIVPCTCDPHRRVRMASIDVLSVLLDLHAYQTCSLRYTSKEKVFLDCKEDLDSFEEEKIFGASARISRVVCMEFSCDEVVSLIQKLCENIGAVDLQHDKASVTWMGTLLQMRVKELEDKVAEIMAIILAHLRSVDHPEVWRTLMEDILLLANHHPDIVLTLLLRQPLPMESHLTEVWLAVTEDPHLTRTMLHGLMGRLQLQFRAHVNATSKADTWRLATVDPMMILCTINVLLDKVDQDDGLPDILPELVYTLLLQLGSSQWPKAASPVLKTWDLVYSDALIQNIKLQRVTINCLKLLIKRGQSGDLMHGLEEQGAWGLLENHTSFLGGIALFTRLFLRNMREHQHHLSQLVLQGMNSDVLSCCIMSTAMCVELMRSPVLHQDKLLKPAMLLLERAVDHEEEVLRVLSLRALGNMAHGAPKKVKKYQKLLLGKFLYCLQEPTNIHVVAEAMASLIKVLPDLREWDLGSMFDNICRQCRAFFDNEDQVLRQKAFILFGKLAAMVRITKKRLFKREVKRAWVPLMLHCLDPCACTAKACMETMSQCLRFCGVKGLESPQGQSTESMEEIALFQTAICALLGGREAHWLHCGAHGELGFGLLSGIILNQMSLRYLKKLDLPALQNLFQELQVDEELGVKKAAHDVLNILDNCNRSRMDS
ncbi:maestro heat-like repeat-containing protein family member 2A [Rhynchocyon petersi]